MPNIDESVVKISLDDSQFDKASDKTIKKLDELKNSLQFNGSVEAFNEIEKAVKKTDFSPMEKGVQAVSNQFNALYTIADATLRRVINGGLDSLERTLKSLTIDNVTAGWSKYADKTSAVQTIMASTANQFADTGEQMEYVENQLDKLNWFTDETSYAFLDMVNNIGKFTSNNVQLDKAATAMQGISTWAAISGAGIQGASHAMYNLAQAIGLGAVTLMDWKSIELANMGTVEFKQMAMEVGAANGELIKLNDSLYKTAKGTTVTIETFRDSLSEKWFTSDVLIDVLNMYGGFADKLYELAEITDMSATPLIRYVNEYKEGTLDLEEAMVSTGLSAEELIGWLEELGADELDLGRRAFAAAQEAKTFQEALDATKEAVGTGWMNTFEIIFGNYEEAKQLWSDLAEGLYEVFVESGNMRNGVLRDWKELNGRTYLLEALYTVCRNIADAVTFFKDAWNDIFPARTGQELANMTAGFRDLVQLLTPTENTVTAVYNAFTLLAKVLQKVGQVALVVVAGLEPIWQLLMEIGGMIVGLIGDITGLFGIQLDEIFSVDTLTGFYNVLYTISSIIAALARGALVEILSILGKILSFGNDIWTAFKDGKNGIEGFVNNIVGLFDTVSSGESIFSKVLNGIYGVAQLVLGGIALLVEWIFSLFTGETIDSNPIVNFFMSTKSAIEDSGVIEKLQSASKAFLSFVSDIFESAGGLEDAGRNLQTGLTWIISQIGILWDWLVSRLKDLSFRDLVDVLLVGSIANLVLNFSTVVKSFSGVANKFGGVLGSISTAINKFTGSGIGDQINKFVANTKFLQMAIAIGVMVSGLVKLANLPSEQLGVAVAGVATIIGLLIALMKVMEKMSKETEGERESGMTKAADNMIKFSAGIGILALAVDSLAMMVNKNWAGVLGGILALGAIMAEIVGFVFLLQKVGPTDEIAKVSAGIVVMATGIGMLSASVAILSLLDIPNLLAAVASVGSLILAFGVAAQLMSSVNVGSILAAAAAVDLMAIGMAALTVPIYALAALAYSENFMTSLIAVGGLLAALTVAIIAISRFSSGSAANLLAASVMMIAFAGAVDILVVAFMALALVPLSAMVPGLIAIGAAIVGLAAAGFIAQNFAVGLAALAAVMLAAGISFSLFANGVKTLVEAVGEFILIAAAVAAAGELIGEDFPRVVQNGMENVELVIRSFLQMIPRLTADIAAAATAIIAALAYGLMSGAPDILNGLLVIFYLLLEAIAKWGGPIIQALADMIDGMADSLPTLFAAAGRFVEEFFAGLGVLVYDALIGMIRGIFSSFGMKGIGDWIADKMHSVGASTVDGFENGIADKQDELNGMAETLGDGVTQSMAKGAGVNSPSWKTELIGLFTGEGFLNGMDSLMPDFNDSGLESMEQFFGGMITGAREGGAKTEGILDSILQMVTGKTNQITEQVNIARAAQRAMDAQYQEIFGEQKSNVDVASEAGAEMGDAFATNFDDSVSSKLGFGKSGGGKAASAVKSAAEKIIESYADALKELDYLDKKHKNEYSLWNAINTDASESEKRAKEIENVTQQIETQTERTRIAEEKYKKISDAMGKASSEARDAELDWLEQKVKLAELQNEIAELTDKTVDALDRLDSIDRKNKAEYDLWSALNVNLSDVEKKTKEVDHINDEIETQIERAKLLEEKYNKLVKDIGEDAKETQDAYIEMLEAQTKLAELQVQQVSTQADIIKSIGDELDAIENTSAIEYELWAALNEDASKATKQAKELEYQSAKLVYQSQRVANAERAWKEAAEDGTRTAKEIRDLHDQWLREQIDYQKQYNTLVELEREAISHNNEILEQLQTSMDRRQKGYDLWTKLNKDVSDAQKSAAEMQKLNSDLETQVQQSNVLALQWKEAIDQYGIDSDEAAEAMNRYYDSISKALDYQNEIAEKQKTFEEEQIEARKRYTDLIVADMNKVDDQGNKVQSTWDFLKEQGFSEDEIRSYFEEQAGIVRQASQEEINTSLEETMSTAQERLKDFGLVMIEDLDSWTPDFGEIGANYVMTLSDGVTTNTFVAEDASTAMIEKVIDACQSDDIKNEWVEIGKGMDAGIVKGIKDGSASVVNAIVSVVMAAISAARRAAGIASPSKLTTWQGAMLDAGWVKGIEDNAASVAKASAKVIQDTINETRNSVGTSSTLNFVGGLIAGGIASGMDNCTYKVLNASDALIKAAEDEVQSQVEGKELFTDILSKLGYGDLEDLSFDIVVNLDAEHAYEEMTDLERALYNYNQLSPRLNEMYDELKYQRGYDALLKRQLMAGLINQAAYSMQVGKYSDSIPRLEAEFEKLSNLAFEYRSIIEKAMNAANPTTVSQARVQYTQNIYSTRPLSTLDIYRNTNKSLLQFS